MKSIRLYDTTLRDGTQGEKISFTAQDKLKVARKLDDMGIHYIEGGWPGASAKDFDFFRLAAQETFQHARIAAFCATHKHGSTPEDDRQLNVVLESGAPVGTIVGKTWDLHVTKILGIPLEANLEMIENSVAYLKKNGLEVHYDAEHFFDGYKENPEYSARTIRAAVAGGADTICLCDTNGGALPHEIEEITGIIKEVIDNSSDRPIHIGIHTHNDSSLAVANSITAIRAGATIVQGTINGYGERCGNADLTSIIPILQLKMGYACISEENLAKLQKVSLYVSETANMTPVNSRPFVGKSAFTHKGGLHVDAIMKEPRSYEHITPELVGNRRRVLISDMAGKGNIRYKARELGFPVDENGYDYAEIVNTVKRLEQEGYQYDVADGSLRILMEKLTDQFQPCFELESFRVTVEKEKDRPCRSHAMIKINVEGIEEITAAEGHGPVSALDNSLRKALNNVYRNVLDPVHLVDFKVRVLDGRDGTGAKVRVLIESRDEEAIWSTIGVSEDIIEASWQALADSFQYKLARITNGNNQSPQEQGK
ncbi:MAG: citramalate synthase [Desulfosalsimonas sp.]|uniref:citramalate synthase n=1 Tax=Desulfosalsimonas sp. TaxID=3073848 RepID=UPI003970B48E